MLRPGWVLALLFALYSLRDLCDPLDRVNVLAPVGSHREASRRPVLMHLILLGF